MWPVHVNAGRIVNYVPMDEQDVGHGEARAYRDMNLKKDFTSRDDPHKDGKQPGREIDKRFTKLKGEN